MSDNEIQKTEKKAKTLPAKKLPSLFRKKYTEKAFNKKILKKIYIESDKELVKSLFTEKIQKGKKEFLSINLENEITKKDFSRFKEIAKAVKSNKGRIKIVPLVAVVSFIAALVIVISIFKNPIAKKIIKAGCETVFEAKTDIGSVNVKLLGISIRVNNIAIGNKNSENYMKNLFEAEKITIDMNFTQALRGKVIINDVSVDGMKFGTERKTSCYIPKKKSEKKSIAESAFVKELKSKSTKAIDDLKTQATTMLGGSSADEIVKNIQSQLKTPEIAKKTQEDVQNLVKKWKEKPNELKTQVDDFSKSVKDIQNLDLNSINDANPAEKIKKLQDALEKVTKAINQGNELKSSFETVTKDIKTDSTATQTMASDFAKAVESDKNLAKNLIGTAQDTVKNAKQLLTNALNTVGYDMLGKYYPYVQQGISYAVQMKNNSKADEEAKSGEKTKKEKEKAAAKRLKGTTFWYAKEYPNLWVKNVSASGYTDKNGNAGFSGAIKNITSNQNLINLPTTAEAKFDVGSINHSGKLTLDVRNNTKADLLAMDYKGVGFKANVNGNKISSSSGIPSIDGNATLTLSGSAGENGFTAKGQVGINPVTLTSDGFANEMVSKYYKEALASIKNLSIGYDVSYQNESGIALTLTGNFAEQFTNALKTALSSAANDAKEVALKKLNEQINNSNNEVLAKIKDFMGIEGDIDIQNTNLESVRKILESKKVEIENQIKGKADEEINKKKAEIEEKAQAEIDKKKSELEEKAKDSIKSNLLKGFKK